MIARRFSDLLARLRGGPRDAERARLAAILELNRGLALAKDRRSLLVLLLDEAVKLFGAERGFVIGCERDGAAHRVEIARSLDREPVHNAAQKVSNTIVARCLGQRTGVFCEDAQEGDFGAAQSVADLALRSVLCMPLLAGEELLGALYLDHRFRSGAFAADDLPWLQAFADQAAITMHLHQAIDENRAHAAAARERSAQLEVEVEAQARELESLRGGRTREALRGDYAELIGAAPALLECLARLERVAETDHPVLLVGESGTGKELAARAIWRNSARRAGPFVPVNLAAVPSSLLESELFGHVRGAFTGAERDRPGLLREAHGGVLFLDEITELAPELQARLLRFLEAPNVRPIGGQREHRVDVRVLAATNREPAAAIEQGRLRADLYYRLAVLTVAMPALRERPGDVPILVRHFLAEAAAARGGPAKSVSAAGLRALAQRRWPGNVRQLRNEVVALDALVEGEEIGAQQLRPASEAGVPEMGLAELERWAIERALAAAGGNKAAAARRLGISRRTLYNKLRPPPS
jgi:DNA-binding NtrC family response regulator